MLHTHEKMNHGRINDIEAKGEYLQHLQTEIKDTIDKFSQYSSSKVHTILDELNNKIDVAREQWLKVDTIDDEVRDFRVVLFKRDVNNKIEEVHTHPNKHSFEISKIQKEYEYLLKERGIDKVELHTLMANVKIEIKRAEIRYMIDHIIDSNWVSQFSFDQIFDKIETAKASWIPVSDLEDELSEGVFG